MTGAEILAYLAPPVELIDHLERYTAQGKLPVIVVEWLERWQGIRSDGATPIDGTSAATWTEVGERVAA